jgi:predicted O-methyltransferase YrrM
MHVYNGARYNDAALKSMSQKLPADPAFTDRSLRVDPIVDVPYAAIDLKELPNPIPAITRTGVFADTAEFFVRNASNARSLMNHTSQALLYTLIRNLRPDHVVEIGTYKGGTAEALARAVHANRHGIVHTVSPFDAELFQTIEQRWPSELRAATRFYPVDSMQFFMDADKASLRFGLVLVDGNHEYEFASFDIAAAAKRLERGGFIVIDNVSQAGPYFAAKDFLARNPSWTDCRQVAAVPDETLAFDHGRSRIPPTDFQILRGPFVYPVAERPQTCGDVAWSDAPVRGLRLRLARPSGAGTLHIQCVLRSFSPTPTGEVVGRGSLAVASGGTVIEAVLTEPLSIAGRFDRYVVEPWLVWRGEAPLELSRPPEPY